ncbi:IS110 family transposase [Microbacterium sp.]|uniref:IS110 family transposase n=1 Tax=Microbacterium sp. TaxID=51671 RepID=UPI0026121C72|nr:IS110 family transposase [Microbacterium sp.]
MSRFWAGVDAGKHHHHCVLIDDDGKHVLSRRVPNDEHDLLNLIGEVHELSRGAVLWATDQNHGGAALLIALLASHGQELLYIPGRTVHHAARTYRGDGKTDAKDAAVIADQARMRRDLQELRSGDAISSSLRILTARRADLVTDRSRAFNRLRATLLEYFPALEAAFDYANTRAAVVLLTRYQTAAGLRRAGKKRVAGWLTKQNCRGADAIAEAAVTAAQAQFTVIGSEAVSADIVSALAVEIERLNESVQSLDRQIETLFRTHPRADILLSLPGFGPRLAAEFIGAVGGGIESIESADRLAGIAGLAPVPRDSGRISGNHHRPHRYDRRLLRACYLSAQSAARYCPRSRAYYEKKRAEGKNHKQAVLALARRRINVIWAMLRDNQPYRIGEIAT